MTAFFRANLGLLIVVVICAALIIILTVVSLLMKRTGASLKPLWWFAGFAALILLPQLIGHLMNAFMQNRTSPVSAESGQPSEPAASKLSTTNYRWQRST